MSEVESWVVIFPNGDRSRSFDTEEQAIDWLASLRYKEPDIRCLIGPRNKIILRADVWRQIKAKYNAGYIS